MKKVFVLLCSYIVICAQVYADDAGEDGLKKAFWGFSGSLEIGYAEISGDGLESIAAGGYGTINGGSLVMLATGGLNYRIINAFDTALYISYLGGGAFQWEDIFGDIGSDFSLYGDSLSVQVEFQPLFSWLSGFHPFIGGGYSFTNGLVDEIGDGFVRGSGPFVVAGLYILNNFGLGPFLPFYTQSNHFFGLRISAYYRFPFSYDFKLDWDAFADHYYDPTDIDVIRSFFGETFAAGSFSIGIGLSLGYLPF